MCEILKFKLYVTNLTEETSFKEQGVELSNLVLTSCLALHYISHESLEHFRTLDGCFTSWGTQ